MKIYINDIAQSILRLYKYKVMILYTNKKAHRLLVDGLNLDMTIFRTLFYMVQF